MGCRCGVIAIPGDSIGRGTRAVAARMRAEWCVMDTTTTLRLLLANVVADAGSIREVVTAEVREPSDAAYLLREVERLQNAAHRIIGFLDEDLIDTIAH